jgi:hypothetical protein
LQISYGRTQTSFSDGGLPIGAAWEDLGSGVRSQVGTAYGTLAKGPRYLEVTGGYVTRMGLDENKEIIGYEFILIGKMMDLIAKGMSANDALEKAKGTFGRFADAETFIDPRRE